MERRLRNTLGAVQFTKVTSGAEDRPLGSSGLPEGEPRLPRRAGSEAQESLSEPPTKDSGLCMGSH